MGKSSLLRRVVDELESCRVLHASGNEPEMLIPYGVIEQLVADSDPAVLDGLALLGALRPDLDPLAVGAELVVLLGALQAECTLVAVVVDDLHWVDRQSAAALLFAFRRLRRDHVLGIVTIRPEALGRLGDSWTSIIAGDPRFARVGLGGLGRAEVAELCVALGIPGITDAGVARLVDHADGNPLYCRSLLEELSVETLNRLTGGLPAPRAMASIVLRRLAALSAAAQHVAAAGSVLGLQFEWSSALSMAEVDDGDAALDELIRSGLLAEDKTRARRVSFSHALIHRAIYDDLAPSARRDLHRKSADVTEGTSSLLHRALSAAGPDADLAAELESAALAADRARLPAQAVDWWIRAADLSPTRADEFHRLLEGFSLAIDLSDLATAGVLKLRLDEFARTPMQATSYGAFALISGEFALAERLLTEVASQTLESDVDYDVKATALAAGALGVYCLLVGRGDEAIRWGETAMAILRSRPIPALIRKVLAFNLVLGGRGAEGLALIGLPEAPNDVGLEDTTVLVFRGAARTYLDDVVGAVADLTTTRARHRAGLKFDYDTHGLMFLIDAAYRAGDWDDAAVHAEFAVSCAHDSDRMWDFGFVHAHAALVPAGRGEWAVATAHLDEAWAWASGFGVGFAMAMVTTAKTSMHAAQGDWESVLAAAETIRSFGHTDTLGRPGVHNWRAPEVEALIALGRLSDATAALIELENAVPPGLVSGQLAVCHLRGLLAAALGNGQAADDAFAEGAPLARCLPIPFQVARFELAHGEHCARQGRAADAAAVLGSAHQRFNALKAHPYIALTNAALAATGQTPIEISGDDFGLTPTEFVVARLVANGKSNREVAGELFVSVKAVEFHMGNIFDKLGIRSRRDISASMSVSA